jgi:hypothetical protein
MSQPVRALALTLVVIAAPLSDDPMAAERAPAPMPIPVPGPWPWLPGRPVPPRGPYFGPPAIPAPSPNPYAPTPYLFPSPSGVTAATDRCVVVAPPTIDPGFVKTAREIDPGIYAAPRVLGLPIPTPEWKSRR